MIENFPFKEESYEIIGLCMEVHKNLGHGFLEIVYKDAIEWEIKSKGIFYEREKEFLIHYKNIILPHKFYADFILHEKIILEIKANDGGFNDEFTAQILNYLRASNCKLGLLINFGRSKLEFKRLIY
ncbi:MAG TPA: GxxExxY protein [Puia sp.]|nr:GxxExxY protein [Puia sp.]